MKREPFGDAGRGYYTVLQTPRGRATLMVWVSLAGAVFSVAVELWFAFLSPGRRFVDGNFVLITMGWLAVAYFAERRRRKLS